jgi:hypothetical protein
LNNTNAVGIIHCDDAAGICAAYRVSRRSRSDRTEEQEQKTMSKHQHPYKQFEKDPMWRLLNKGIDALVKNGDLQEKTARTHIVGYLTKLLRESSGASTNGRHQRVVQVKAPEELLVRAV